MSSALCRLADCNGFVMFTVSPLWNTAEKYRLETVKSKLYHIISRNLQTLMSFDEDSLCELPKDLLYGALSVPDVDVESEVDIMKIIKTWVLYDKETRMKELVNLCECVHIPSVRKGEVKQIDDISGCDRDTLCIADLYASYLDNPHTFLKQHQGQAGVRNGTDVLMLVCGQSPNNRQSSGKDTLMYVPIGEINKQFELLSLQETSKNANIKDGDNCHNRNDRPTEQIGNKPRLPHTESISLCFRSIKNVEVENLLDFGVCVYDNFVYVAGGQSFPSENAKHVTRQVHRLDCCSGIWSEVSPMTVERFLFYMCAVQGRLYAVGGANKTGILSHVEYYNPQENIWVQGRTLPSKLHEHTGCAFDSKLYVSGGHNDLEHTDQLLVLDSPDDQWRHLARMSQARSYHSIVYSSQHLYVFGGCCQVGEGIQHLYSVEQYSIQTDTWVCIIDLPLSINCSLPVLCGDVVLFVGSYCFDKLKYIDQAVAVNIKTGDWEKKQLIFSGRKQRSGFQGLMLTVSRRWLEE